MSFGVTGNYFLSLYIAGVPLPLQPRMCREITVTQDIDRLLPVFRLHVQDNSGNLSNLLPYDKLGSSVTMEIGHDPSSDQLNRFPFRILRRIVHPTGSFEIEGMLDVPQLYNDVHTRGWSQSVKSVLESVAGDDLEISNPDISPALDYVKILVQPSWTDAKWLMYLAKRLVGNGGEFGWRCFISNKQGEMNFVFRTPGEIFTDPVKYNFIVGEKAFQDHHPLCEIQVFDNSGLLSSFGPNLQHYKCFDFATGTYQDLTTSIDDQPGLTEFHLVDTAETAEGLPYQNFGRTNDFTQDFLGPAQALYGDRLLESVQMWAVSMGLENIVPGDIVKVVYGEQMTRGNMFVYQHSGYWMVKKVIHIFDTSFVTRMLLVRTGIDTALDTTLTAVQVRGK